MFSKTPDPVFYSDPFKNDSSSPVMIIAKAQIHCNKLIIFYRIVHFYHRFGAAQDSLSVMKTGIRLSAGHWFPGSRAVCTSAAPKA